MGEKESRVKRALRLALRNRAPKRRMAHDVGRLKAEIFGSASLAVGRKTRRVRPGSTPGSVRA